MKYLIALLLVAALAFGVGRELGEKKHFLAGQLDACGTIMRGATGGAIICSIFNDQVVFSPAQLPNSKFTLEGQPVK